ncbi:MAG: FHA domain-containing protein [Planctomycetota bacterium]|jgi:GAF domain-containing protein|nr:FHA domain-containing protein [Planctomycetota bacterium]
MAEIRFEDRSFGNNPHQIGKQRLRIGRDPSCQIQILDKNISRQHAEIFRVGEMCFIRDLNSRNGISVNDRRAKEELLRDGDKIQIGATTLIFSDRGAPEFADDEKDTDDLSAVSLNLEDLNDPATLTDLATRRLRFLCRLGVALAADENLEELNEQILPLVGEQFAAATYVFTRQAGGAVTPLGSFLPNGCEPGKISKAIIKRTLLERRALRIDDAHGDERFQAEESVITRDIGAVLCAPLSATNAIDGVLYLAAPTADQKFSDDDLELLAATATQLGAALARQRDYRQLEDDFWGTLTTLTKIFEQPAERAEAVAHAAVTIARHLALPPRSRHYLQLAGLLHRLGEISAPEYDRVAPSAPLPADRQKEHGERTLALIRPFDRSGELEKILHSVFSGQYHFADAPLEAQILGMTIEMFGRLDPNDPNAAGEATARIIRELTPNHAHETIHPQSA